MVNQTGKPLDPQLFIGPVSAGSTALFVPANKRTDFGFGGLGLLEANGTAQVTIGCDQVVFIGTQGGIFGDDLTNPVAQGQALALQAGLSVPCGDVLTFTYTAAGSTLRTSYAVAPQ